eukprot:2441149-Lingulodinium_polyedra.AAC.1
MSLLSDAHGHCWRGKGRGVRVEDGKGCIHGDHWGQVRTPTLRICGNCGNNSFQTVAELRRM